MTTLSRLPSVWVIAITALLTSACGHVAAYEREHLSRPTMDAAREANEVKFYAHVQDSREGATGGSSSTGGGCGCN